MNAVPQAFAEAGVQLLILVLGWSALGVLVLALLCAVFAARSFAWEDSGWSLAAMVLGACGGVVALLWVTSLIPFDGKYQHYYEVSGHVDSVSNVLSDADGDLTRQPVVVLDNVDRPLVIDDPRAVSLDDADVTLRCSIEWNYQAADSYSCRIVDFDAEVTR